MLSLEDVYKQLPSKGSGWVDLAWIKFAIAFAGEFIMAYRERTQAYRDRTYLP